MATRYCVELEVYTGAGLRSIDGTAVYTLVPAILVTICAIRLSWQPYGCRGNRTAATATTHYSKTENNPRQTQQISLRSPCRVLPLAN